MLPKFTLLILLITSNLVIAEELRCKAVEPEYSWKNSLREVVVNTESKEVGIRYSNDRKLRTVPLLHKEKSRFYFNKPTHYKDQFNAYMLISSGSDSRILDVGLTDLNGVPILRSGSGNEIFECTETK